MPSVPFLVTVSPCQSTLQHDWLQKPCLHLLLLQTRSEEYKELMRVCFQQSPPFRRVFRVSGYSAPVAYTRQHEINYRIK